MTSILVDFSLALRNIVRQSRRSAIAIAAIGFGVVALLLAGGFIEWIFWAMREDTIQSRLGHIQITRPGYHDAGLSDPFAYLLPARSPELAGIEATPGVKVVAPRLSFSGLVSIGESTVSFVGEGVDPAKEKSLSRAVIVTQGEGLATSDPKGIVMGQGLASNLGVRIGDTVVLLANTPSGGINAAEGRVRGFFSTITKSYDDSALRVPIPMARELLKVNGSHAWITLLDRTDHTDAVLASLRSRYPDKKLEFVPWTQLADFYNKTVVLFSRQVGVVKLIIGIIIVLSISNTMIMSVMERTGEIGTSMALGVRRFQIMRLFLSEGVLLGVAGGGLGLIVGYVLALVISAIGIPMPPPPGMARGFTGAIRITGGLAFDAFLLSVGTTLLASVYPAWKASRMVIVDALRFNR